MWREGASPRRGARASHCSGFSCCGARALGLQASAAVARGLLSAGSVAAPRHVGSSPTRARTHIPCNGRRFLTTEAPGKPLYQLFLKEDLRRCHKHFCLYLIGQNFSTWPILIAREAGKYAQLNLVFYNYERRGELLGGTTSSLSYRCVIPIDFLLKCGKIHMT